MSTTPAWLRAAAQSPLPDDDVEEIVVEGKPSSRITAAPQVVIPSKAIPAGEEVDLAWRGYSALALVPGTLALAVITICVVIVLRPLVPAWVMHEAADAPLAALWLLQTIRATYRLLAYDYRLTTRRLFRSRGPLYPAEPPLDLATIARVDVRQTPFGRLVGVGSVFVMREDGTAALELDGIRRPKWLAARIEEAATAAREANVTVGRAGSVSDRRME